MNGSVGIAETYLASPGATPKFVADHHGRFHQDASSADERADDHPRVRRALLLPVRLADAGGPSRRHLSRVHRGVARELERDGRRERPESCKRLATMALSIQTCRCGGAGIEVPEEHHGPVTCGAADCGGLS